MVAMITFLRLPGTSEVIPSSLLLPGGLCLNQSRHTGLSVPTGPRRRQASFFTLMTRLGMLVLSPKVYIDNAV